MKENRHEARELAVSTLYALDFNNSLSTDINWSLLQESLKKKWH